MKIFKLKKGGVHPPENKSLTEDKEIERFEIPEKVYIAMSQHIGAPGDPIVKVGDEVKIGQKIAESGAFVSAPIHASVSGKVVKIEDYPYPINGKVKTIIIENNKKEEWVELKGVEDYKSLDKKELLDIIREKGIVGQGGATFPTSIKLNPPKDKTIDTLLMNGAECEPYLNADNRVMLEQAEDMIEGIKIMLHILGIKKAIIGIEENKLKAIQHIKQLIKKESMISVAVLKTQYPQGGEKQLIKAVLDREVPSKALPAEVGVVVQNVATAKAVYDAIVKGIPLIERVLTVTGFAVKEPKNLLVRVGTKFEEILDHVGVDKTKMEKLVMGGPMMGLAQYTSEVPTLKGTSGILALSKEEMNRTETESCISCGKCITVCPMGLMPLMFAKLGRFEEWKEMDRYNLMDCIECGSCSYICPANRPLTEAIKIGKNKLRDMKK